MRAHAIALFRNVFDATPRSAASAPGRVNLIGEHTDYNGGPVLPIAIGARTVAVAGAGHRGVLEAVSARDGRLVRVDWREGNRIPSGWPGYLVGVLRELDRLGAAPAGARVAVASDVPVGAGLSSSAALTVSSARALASLMGARLSPRAVAGVAYRAEHDHVGVRCGIMDQTISALGRAGHALLLECATGATRFIPFAGDLLIVDSGVRHELAASAFNERRAQCEAALERLRAEEPGLRDLAAWPVDRRAALRRLLEPPLWNRALHVVDESARTRRGAALLARGRLREFGMLLWASHESCRVRYECSAPELDLLVRAARRAGAWGARLTGAGWGGAVLVLTGPAGRATASAKIAAAMSGAFRRAYGRDPVISSVRASGGARPERVDRPAGR